jgi:hypothetical protein
MVRGSYFIEEDFMRRLCRLVTGAGLLVTLALGCGSSGEDGLVLRFVGFDASGISQDDTVTATSAVVCVNNPNLPPLLTRDLTPTLINAIFINEEAADIHLNSYKVHFNDPSSGVADVTASITSNPNLPGGRCSSGNKTCAVDADCLTSGGSSGSGTESATCDHSESTVEGIVLVDETAKAHVNPEIYGQTTTLSVTFVGEDDANRTFEVTAGYAVVFSDALRCGSGEPTPGVTPAATATATATPVQL